jgi:hypothetical protein
MKIFWIAPLLFAAALARAGDWDSGNWQGSVVTSTMATSVPASGVQAGSLGVGVIASSITRTAFSPVFTSSTPATASFNVASTNYVGIATVTVTLAGGRPLYVPVCLTIQNGSGGSRTYTVAIVEDGTPIHEHQITNAGGGDSNPNPFMPVSSDTGGTHTFALWVKTSNATGTQTVVDPHITVMEY